VIAICHVNVLPDVHELCAGVTHVKEIIGAVVSYMIVSFICDDRFHTASQNFTYTVFVSSHALHHEPFTIFHVLLVLYASIGLRVLLLHENCINVASVADNVNVVDTLFVYAAQPLILIDTGVGATVSIETETDAADHEFVFHAKSTACQ
jgi:hypothetical protein